MTAPFQPHMPASSGSYQPSRLNCARGRSARGMELEAEGKVDEAIELYEQDVAAGLTTIQPYKRLRVIYERRHQLASAIRVCQAAVQAFSAAPKQAHRFEAASAKLQKRAAWAMMERGMRPY
jgi:hypothetical protein